MLCKTCQLDLEHSDGGAGLQCARRPVYQDAVQTWHTRRRYLERQDTDPRTDDELFTALYREAHLHDLTMHTAHQHSLFSNIVFAHASRIEDDIFPGSRHTRQAACCKRFAWLARPARGPKTWSCKVRPLAAALLQGVSLLGAGRDGCGGLTMRQAGECDTEECVCGGVYIESSALQ